MQSYPITSFNICCLPSTWHCTSPSCCTKFNLLNHYQCGDHTMPPVYCNCTTIYDPYPKVLHNVYIYYNKLQCIGKYRILSWLWNTAISSVISLILYQWCIVSSDVCEVVSVGNLKVRYAGWWHTSWFRICWYNMSGICWLLLKSHSTFVPCLVLITKKAQTFLGLYTQYTSEEFADWIEAK